MTELASPLAKFLREFLPRDRGMSRHTIESYVLCLKLLVVFVADKRTLRPSELEIGHLDTATILAFLDHLEQDRGERGPDTQYPSCGHQGLLPVHRIPVPGPS